MLVSVCMPVYNAGAFIGETLNCLLKQSHQALEIIVINDGSTDESAALISEIQNLDNRIILKNALKKGAAAARNQAFNLSNGKYIIFFDADDLVPENFIETQLKTLQANTEVVVSNWGRFYNNSLSTFVPAPFVMQKDLSFLEWVTVYWPDNLNMTCPGRILVPRQVIDAAGLWNEALTLNDDFPFFTRIFSVCSCIRFNEQSVFYYRSGLKGSLSGQKSANACLSALAAITEGTDYALNKDKSDTVKKAAAALFQNLAYEAYPQFWDVYKKARKKVAEMGGSACKFPAGGITAFMLKIFGWKLTKRIKLLLKH